MSGENDGDKRSIILLVESFIVSFFNVNYRNLRIVILVFFFNFVYIQLSKMIYFIISYIIIGIIVYAIMNIEKNGFASGLQAFFIGFLLWPFGLWIYFEQKISENQNKKKDPPDYN